MATLNTRVNNARTLNNVDESQYTDANALLHVNIVIHKIEDFIVKAIWEGFFWDILSVQDSVINQNEYNLPKNLPWAFNEVNKIEAVSIKYRNNYDFIPVTEKNRELLIQQNDLSWYEKYQSESKPIYFIADNSIFIYPSPKESIEWSIKIYWIKSLADVTLTTPDSNLFGGKIPTKYFDTISEWLEPYILRILWKKQEAIQSEDRFENIILPRLLDKLGNRKVGITPRQFITPKIR